MGALAFRPAIGFKVDDGGPIPQRAYKGDAGFDLTCSESCLIMPHALDDIPTGLAMELPEGVWGWIVGRSSTVRKRGLLVIDGIIDQGYRGPLFVGAFNLTDEPVEVSEGDRIAQMIPVALVDVATYPVSELSPSERGERGFGSSGS